jgi:hypothetical protein
MNDASITGQIYRDRSVISPQYDVSTIVQPDYPIWPTSLPGPFRVPIPPGMKPINAIRSEQLVAVSYDQATGESVEM